MNEIETKRALLKLPEHLLRVALLGRIPKPTIREFWGLHSEMESLEIGITHVTADEGTKKSDRLHRLFGHPTSIIEDVEGVIYGWTLSWREYDLAILQEVRDSISA